MLGYPPGVDPPSPEQTPPEQCMLGDVGNKRVVRILLECILVFSCGYIFRGGIISGIISVVRLSVTRFEWIGYVGIGLQMLSPLTPNVKLSRYQYRIQRQGRGWVGGIGGARNMRYMRPSLAAIFFMTYDFFMTYCA